MPILKPEASDFPGASAAAQTPQRYSAVAQTLHWVTAIAVALAYAFGPGGSEQRVYSPARDFERGLHETLGITVLALAAIRTFWWLLDTPPAPAPVPRWMALAAATVRVALYGLLFAVPLTAIAGAWLEGHPLTLLGGVRIAPRLAESHALGAAIAEIHTWLGDAILWVAGFHALAALYHHFILKDGVFVAMLPRWLYRGRATR